jgi:hypothetical protein
MASEAASVNSMTITHDDMLKYITQDIDEDYAYGKYSDFEIIIRKSDGYINATKLCKDAGKFIEDWMFNLENKQLISEITKLGTVENMTDTVIIGDLSIRGIYVHPDLILAIAIWCSTEYYLRVSAIMKNYHLDEMRKINDQTVTNDDDKSVEPVTE